MSDLPKVKVRILVEVYDEASGLWLDALRAGHDPEDELLTFELDQQRMVKWGIVDGFNRAHPTNERSASFSVQWLQGASKALE